MSKATLRRFNVRYADDNQVLLEVDTAILTPELATEINSFWGSDKLRLAEQGGDIVQTVVRLFGARAIFSMQADGGADFSEGAEGSSEFWTERVLELQVEGWPDLEHLGIRIVQAYVTAADYFDVALEALPS
jgi:Protein of unknown function (DUF2528)